jgi:DNA helicase HerA-like ATPase
MVNVIAADALMQAPKVYASFLLWLLSELFEQLPEVGDQEQPTVVFFFDEAHLLFEDASSALVDKIEQVVRLIRSKGVGVYFVTQNPLDVPEKVLAQLGNRVQHALRAFTPRDQRAVRAAAETLRANPALDTTKTITELAVGEALVSCLDAKGIPGVVERAWVLPPASRIGTITDAERRAVIDASTLRGRYDQAVDRASAYETLTARAAARATATAPGGGAATTAQAGSALGGLVFGTTGPRGGHHPGLLESALKSTARSIGSGFGRQIVRGVLGSLFGRRR